MICKLGMYLPKAPKAGELVSYSGWQEIEGLQPEFAIIIAKRTITLKCCDAVRVSLDGEIVFFEKRKPMR